MKTVLLATVISGLTASTSVLAAGEFEGPWVGAGMGFRGQNTKVTDNNTGQEVDGLGKNSIFGVLQGGYAWRFGDWNIGPYGFYLIGTTTSDVVTPTGGFFNGTTSFEMKWKNQWGIGVQPGYYLSANTIMYLKMSYNRTKAELVVNTSSDYHCLLNICRIASSCAHGSTLGSGLYFIPILYSGLWPQRPVPSRMNAVELDSIGLTSVAAFERLNANLPIGKTAVCFS